MKKIKLLSVMLLATVTMAFAQGKDMFIGGSLILNTTKDGDVGTTFFQISPDWGYVINPTFKVGAGLGFIHESVSISGNSTKNNSFFIRLFGRYTIADVKKFNFFAQADLPLIFRNGSDEIGVEVNIRPGISYAINETWGITLIMPQVVAFDVSSNKQAGFYFGINDGYNIQRYLLSSSFGVIYKF